MAAYIEAADINRAPNHQGIKTANQLEKAGTMEYCIPENLGKE